jgi:hypothetical protein
MKWLPSQGCPDLPFEEIPALIRAGVGRPELTRIWHDLWWSGVAAGRVEGIVGTMLVGLTLAVVVLMVAVLVIVVYLRWSSKRNRDGGKR